MRVLTARFIDNACAYTFRCFIRVFVHVMCARCWSAWVRGVLSNNSSHVCRAPSAQRPCGTACCFPKDDNQDDNDQIQPRTANIRVVDAACTRVLHKQRTKTPPAMCRHTSWRWCCVRVLILPSSAFLSNWTTGAKGCCTREKEGERERAETWGVQSHVVCCGALTNSEIWTWCSVHNLWVKVQRSVIAEERQKRDEKLQSLVSLRIIYVLLVWKFMWII